MFYKRITKQEIDAMERVDGITPNYTYEDYVIVRDEEIGEILEEYYTNLTIHKTADEVYEENLNPQPIPPDKNTILLELQEENKLLKAQVNALNGVTDFHEELIVEMANKVYA